jgi:hypothetical protein
LGGGGGEQELCEQRVYDKPFFVVFKLRRLKIKKKS